MGCYRLNGQTCKCRCIPLPDTGRRVCTDQEDGAVEVIDSSGLIEETFTIPLVLFMLSYTLATDRDICEISVENQDGWNFGRVTSLCK